METRTRLTDAEIEAFAPDSKVGLVATVDEGGLPHVSLITTLAAKDPTHLTFGQFCDGRSKSNVERDPRVGFLVLTLERDLWRGRARWTRSAGEGEDYETYNQRPMFRYNSYFGIHTVHYLDLIEVSAKQRLPLPLMIAGYGIAAAGKLLKRRRDPEPALKPWAQGLLDKLDTVKFISYVGDDGFPVIVPAVPAMAAGSRRLVFSPTVYRRELGSIRRGSSVALFAMNMQMESVLVRGEFGGYQGAGPARLGTIEIDWVYNSMPPQQGQIYPRPPLEPVRAF